MNPHFERYRELMRDEPELFQHSDSDGYRLVLDDETIREAGLQDVVGVPYEDRYLRLLRDAVRFPSGKVGTYLRILKPRGSSPGVAVLCVSGGKVVLLDQFRHATRQWELAIPRGFGEPGCSLEENVRRELYEELRAVPDRMVRLGSVHPDTGLMQQQVELAYAEVPAIGELEQDEAIRRVELKSPDEVEGMIREGRITDGFTLAAMYHATLAGLLGMPF